MWFNGKPMNKHQYRSAVVQKKKEDTGRKVKKRKPAKLVSRRTNSKRLPMTRAMKTLLPLGFDERLLQLNDAGDRRLYTEFNADWFRESYDELMVEVKRLLDTPMAPSMEAKFRARVYLHKWLVDKVVVTAAGSGGGGGCRGGGGGVRSYL